MRTTGRNSSKRRFHAEAANLCFRTSTRDNGNCPENAHAFSVNCCLLGASFLLEGAVQPDAIRRYLSLGFVPDAGIATEYVHSLLGAPDQRDGDPGDLLVEIVEDLTSGSGDVAIPLSAGFDSRGLLGAALRIFPKKRIHCFTFGPEQFDQVLGARAACRRAGVEHHVVDPIRIEWDMAAIQREAQRRLRAGLGVAPIDGLAIFTGLAAAIPRDMAVLSGFLGDIVTGKLVFGDRADNDPELALSRFYQHNAVLLNERPDGLFLDFLRSQQQLKAHWPGLTTYDLLNIGFRQRLRIRSVTTAAFAKAIRPYEDPRWIAYWFSKPLAKRVDQRSYVNTLQRHFPAQFPRYSGQSRHARWLNSAKVACSWQARAWVVSRAMGIEPRSRRSPHSPQHGGRARGGLPRL